MFGIVVLLSAPHWTHVPHDAGDRRAAVHVVGIAAHWHFVGQYRSMRHATRFVGLQHLRRSLAASCCWRMQSRLDQLIRWYDKFSHVFLITCRSSGRLRSTSAKQFPTGRGSISTSIQIKEGDTDAAASSRSGRRGWEPKVSRRWVALLTVDLAICGVIDRGGLVAISVRAGRSCRLLLRPLASSRYVIGLDGRRCAC